MPNPMERRRLCFGCRQSICNSIKLIKINDAKHDEADPTVSVHPTHSPALECNF